MFNISNWEHAAIAVVIQLAIGLPLLLVTDLGLAMSGLVASSLFLGREFSQNEYRAVRQGLYDSIKTMPLLGAFELRWTLDSVLDAIFPIAANIIIDITFYFMLPLLIV